MPDPVRAVLEMIDRIKQNVEAFQADPSNASGLEAALDHIEELHDDIEDILEDSFNDDNDDE